jgi:hypothetical protein
MKRIIFTTLIGLFTVAAFAQKNKTDSVRIFDKKKGEYIKVSPAEWKRRKDSWGNEIIFDKNRGEFIMVTPAEYGKIKDSIVAKMEKKGNLNVGKFQFGPTFARFDLGLTTLIDNGSFTLQPKNDFLSYRSWKSSNVGFDLVELGFKGGKRFNVYLSGGFDWTLIRLRKDITIQKNSTALTYTNDTIHYTKNRFSSEYLRIPLSFEFKSKEDSRGKRSRFIIGPEIGLLMGGRVKQKSEENGKQKIDDDYHFAKMRYGAFVRMGSGWGGLYAKYYFNDMFENSPAQKGLKNFAFGLTFGF